MPEHVDQCREPPFAIGVDIEAGIIEEARASTQADAAVAHVAGDHLGRAITVAAERALEIAAGVIENIAATPVDELEQAKNCKTDAEAVLDRLSTSAALATPSSTSRAASFIASA